MNVYEQKLRARIRQLIRESYEDDEDFEFTDEELAQQRSDIATAADSKEIGQSWSDIQFKPKKSKPEFWEDPLYSPEPVEEPGGYGHPMTLEKIAGEVEGLNTPSAVRQFLADPRKINLMDKVRFLLQMPEKERQNVMIGAGADFITKLENDNLKHPLDHNDPAIKSAVEHYISDLEGEGVIDPDDADTLRKRTEYVIELGSFKTYLVDYFDNNFDELLKNEQFREHLKKYWRKMMRSDPNLKAYVEKRKEADLERVRRKKAARKAAKK
jgi:hypothetical protein